MMKRCILALLGGFALASPASAAITAFKFNTVDNTAGAPALNGFTTTDVLIDFDSRWVGAEMLITLEQGSIYQNAYVAGNGPPSQILQTIDPASAFDSYVTLNARSADELEASLLVIGGAVDLGASYPIQFDEEGVNATWVYQLSFADDFFLPFENQTDFLISRISLSDDAVGTFTVLASAGGLISTTSNDFSSVSALFAEAAATTDPNAPLLVEGAIVNGTFAVPEPTTAGLLALSLLATLRRRSA